MLFDVRPLFGILGYFKVIIAMVIVVLYDGMFYNE